MNDDATKREGATPAGSGRNMVMQKTYLKDLSFESPQGYLAFQDIRMPKIEVDMRMTYSEWEQSGVEVTLHLRLHMITAEIRTMYLIELQQAGMFVIEGYSGKEREQLINRECPAALFPFAREVVWSIVGRGGFPALLLRPLDLDAMLSQVAAVRVERDAESTPAA